MEIKDAVFVYQMKQEEEIKWHGRLHKHIDNWYEVHYFLQGEGVFLNGNTAYTITPGALFLTPPNTLHSIQAHNLDDPITYYAVLVSVPEHERSIRELLDSEIKRAMQYHIGTNHRFFFEEIREKGMSRHRNLQLSAVHQLISFIYQLSSDDVTQYAKGDNVHLEKAIRFMQKNVMSSISLSDIANHLHLTESYFIRLFKRRIHTTPMKYYTRLKIEAAGAMLAETTLSVKEISAKLCFYSEFHFSKMFKHYTGVAPSNYRTIYLQQLGVSPDSAEIHKRSDPPKADRSSSHE